MLRQLWRRLRYWRTGSAEQDSLEEEMRLHVALRARKLRDAGVEADEAAHAAQRRFGNALQLREESRRMWIARWWDDFARDIRIGVRGLRRSASFTSLAVLAIALGIGANTALFSIVNAVVLRPLPFPEPERLVLVWEARPDQGFFKNPASNANYLDWRSRNRDFEAMSPIVFGTNTLTGAGEPEEIPIQMIGEDYFAMLGVRLPLGRSFSREECKPGAPMLAVLSDSLWRTKFRAERRIVGQTVRLGNEAVEVVGVAPLGILNIGDRPPALWLNARLSPVNRNGTRASGRNFAVLARLQRGVTVDAADRHMVGLARELELAHPQTNAKWSARVAPLADEFSGSAKTPLFVMLGAVACVLLIACANVANLLLTRAAGRGREMAVRASLGATRGMLLRQLLAESMALAAIGAVAGLVLGKGLLEVLKATGPQDLRRLGDAALDAPVLAFTLALTLLTGLLLGFAPALAATRRVLNESLREGGRGSTGGSRVALLREGFAAAEIALSLMLLVGAGLLLKSFFRLTAVDPGFRASQVLTADLLLPRDRYPDQQGVRFFTELNRRLREMPGVVDASNVTFAPFRGRGAGTYYWRQDRPKPAPGQELITDVRMVQPRYFETMGIPLRRGRTFTDADNEGKAPLRFVISEAMARTTYPNEDPIGHQLTVLMGPAQNLVPGEIIGVVGDTRHDKLTGSLRGSIYYPQSHLFFQFGTVVVRTTGEPLALARPFAALVRQMDPQLPVSGVGTMQGWVDDSVARPRFQARLLAGFSALALVLAVIGIYGVMSYGVAQRTQEIGIRIALGAQGGDVARMILKRGLALALAGLAVGLAGALILGRSLKTLLFAIEPADPVNLATVTALLLAVALAACYVPARRATRVDPMRALRSE